MRNQGVHAQSGSPCAPRECVRNQGVHAFSLGCWLQVLRTSLPSVRQGSTLVVALPFVLWQMPALPRVTPSSIQRHVKQFVHVSPKAVVGPWTHLVH